MLKFYSNNNRDLLTDIHKLNNIQSVESEFTDQAVIMEYVIEKRQQKNFHLVKSQDEGCCETLVCKLCENDQFIIGQKEYFTALKCVNCNYEIGIHEG